MALNNYRNPTLTAEAHEHCDSQMVKLRELLPELNNNLDLMLCYVATDMPANAPISSPIAICIIPTLGGVQYGISEYALGRRGGGVYHQLNDNAGMEADILTRLRYYHRTTPFTAKYGMDKHNLNQFMLIRKP